MQAHGLEPVEGDCQGEDADEVLVLFSGDTHLSPGLPTAGSPGTMSGQVGF